MMRRGSGYGITVLRVTLGIIFLLHGYLAVFVYTPAGVTAFNAKMGIPLPAIMAWFVILGHFLGGGLARAGVPHPYWRPGPRRDHGGCNLLRASSRRIFPAWHGRGCGCGKGGRGRI